MTLPELIEYYRDFLENVAKYYPVLITIDEMDKISSSADAQKFLNEIKAIFNITGCVYLVSISDNALSTFDRRGIGLRDEFDTTFDFVLALGVPDLNYAKELIWRRVIGMPMAFIYLTYIFSGGIPRDVIRTCREIMYVAQSHKDGISISEMCTELVLQNLKSKAHAIFITATNQAANSGSDILFESINHIESIKGGDRGLSDKMLHLYKLIVENSAIRIASETPEMAQETLLLRNELKTYLHFYSTVLSYFHKVGARKKISLINQNEEHYLDILAAAQRSISLNADYAHSLINDFRNNFGMPLVDSNESLLSEQR